ncbi:TolB family protein [Robiginitalea sediminis]|uniref:TolB family protein n=1 Tax=Robiginitalea sediminis TaxID=1982593 RepID=UPI000B4AA165|nr:PD40 domain-containing protein [Robiginitalea sediminis]
MNPFRTYRMLLGLIGLCCVVNLQAQRPVAQLTAQQARSEADKRIEAYMDLVKLGYSDREIYEDLGNVSFLSENYETAAFWYQKLMDLAGADAVPESYQERYQYSLHKAGIVRNEALVAQRDWYSKIKQDYQIDRSSHAAELTRSLAENYQMPDFGRSGRLGGTEGLDALRAMSEADLAYMESERIPRQTAYTPPVTLTADGRTAYFSKAELVKPLYGLFSKKQLVHKIYRADKVGGEWKNVQEVALVPKYASAVHPAVSPDGTRLYFASDMPGSFGKYDIYVADIDPSGRVGGARNLGEKINTRKNDLYPSLLAGNVLFFASDGRDGYGGLDLYAARIARRSVGLAINIGSPFNSVDDEFALNLESQRGMAFVMSNRGTHADDVRELVFSYFDQKKNSLAQNGNPFMEIISIAPEASYAETLFED